MIISLTLPSKDIHILVTIVCHKNLYYDVNTAQTIVRTTRVIRKAPGIQFAVIKIQQAGGIRSILAIEELYTYCVTRRHQLLLPVSAHFHLTSQFSCELHQLGWVPQNSTLANCWTKTFYRLARYHTCHPTRTKQLGRAKHLSL